MWALAEVVVFVLGILIEIAYQALISFNISWDSRQDLSWVQRFYNGPKGGTDKRLLVCNSFL